MKRYVWIDINTGKFSNSWSEETQLKFGKGLTDKLPMDSGAKLIEYTCLNDDKFELYDLMQITTKTK